jgi:hypothetical protein
VPEREIGDVRLGQKFGSRCAPILTARFAGWPPGSGVLSEPDDHHQVTYRVEKTIENADGLLRPGMTAFARIDFSHQSVGQGPLHRPELWML